MRKRSKYRPRPIRVDPIGYVMEGLSPVMRHESFALDLQTKNHFALTMLTQGTATKQDINVLISALNITESLWRLGFGAEYRNVVDAGLRALRTVGGRGLVTNKFILNAAEMAALNEAMDLHDAQLDIITVRDMEHAIAIVHQEMKHKRATPIQEKS